MSNQLVIRIDPRLKKQVEVEAKKQGRSTAGLVKYAITEYLDRLELKTFITKAAEEEQEAQNG